MAVLLISYDLNGHERPASYARVKALIERQAQAAITPLYSQWFVQTNNSPDDWSGWLQQVTDPNDRWFICHVTRPNQGWLNQNVWDWLNARL